MNKLRISIVAAVLGFSFFGFADSTAGFKKANSPNLVSEDPNANSNKGFGEATVAHSVGKPLDNCDNCLSQSGLDVSAGVGINENTTATKVNTGSTPSGAGGVDKGN